MTLRSLTLAAVALLALAGCSSHSAAPVSAPISMPSPTPTHLDERAACQALTPALQDGETVMRDFLAHADGSTIDRLTLSETVATLQQVKADGPPDLEKQVKQLLDPLASLQAALQTGVNRQIETLQFMLTAQLVIDNCKPYAG